MCTVAVQADRVNKKFGCVSVTGNDNSEAWGKAMPGALVSGASWRSCLNACGEVHITEQCNIQNI